VEPEGGSAMAPLLIRLLRAPNTDSCLPPERPAFYRLRGGLLAELCYLSSANVSVNRD